MKRKSTKSQDEIDVLSKKKRSVASNDNPSSSVSLDTLPEAVIKKIFIYAGPQNNLPLVNKRINEILKFNPNPSDEVLDNGPWKNFSLVQLMMEHHYLYSLIDDDLLELANKKAKYFANLVSRELETSVEDGFLKPMQQLINDLQVMLVEYSRLRFAILDDFVFNRFATGKVIAKIVWGSSRTRWHVPEHYTEPDYYYPDLLPIKTVDEIDYIKRQRLLSLHKGFYKLEYYYTLYQRQAETGEFFNMHIFFPVPELIENQFDIKPLGTPDVNPPLPKFDDLFLPPKGYQSAMLTDSHQDILRNEIISATVDNASWTLPPVLFRRDFEFSSELLRSHGTRDVTPILEELVRFFSPARFVVQKLWKRFDEYVEDLLSFSVSDWDGDQTSIDKVIDLYTLYCEVGTLCFEGGVSVEEDARDIRLEILAGIKKLYKASLGGCSFEDENSSEDEYCSEDMYRWVVYRSVDEYRSEYEYRSEDEHRSEDERSPEDRQERIAQ